MENFREKLKIQNWVCAGYGIILAVFCMLGFAGEAGLIPFLNPAAGDSHWQSMWRGFISGACCGILTLMVICLIRNFQALRDEKKLKKLYVKENDERMLQIYTHARAAAMQAVLLLGLVAVIVAGYFSVTVSLTILACVLVCSLITVGYKVYYNKKF